MHQIHTIYSIKFFILPPSINGNSKKLIVKMLIFFYETKVYEQDLRKRILFINKIFFSIFSMNLIKLKVRHRKLQEIEYYKTIISIYIVRLS